jgi:bifunctional UDP-N-acetylglucosamine pyrophosphorylase/glucosamine-1-phosphate N-acetyltransferase
MKNNGEARSTEAKELDVLILAAGLGTRMRSNIAKVLHQLRGKPLISHVFSAASALDPHGVYVVVGHQAESVETAVRTAAASSDNLYFVTQASQRGTGDAVMAAREVLAGVDSTLLVVSGDVPLIKPETMRELIDAHQHSSAAATILTVDLPDPTGYGRIVRDAVGRFERIVEQKDATEEERKLTEINAGIYCFNTSLLFSALEKVEPANAQGEYYLTDVPSILRDEGQPIAIFSHCNPIEVSGINNRAELAAFEARLRRETVNRLMIESGVTMIDPEHTYISPEARFGRDCIVYPDVHIEGDSIIGDNCEIRSGTRISYSKIGDNVTVKDHCVIVNSEIAAGCSVGPFAHLRMGTVLEEGAVVGNFVEMKKSRLGKGSKSMHLTYLGDATIGTKTNIGAGTITANYDGKQKHPTIIRDGVKIGSNTVLVAPVSVDSGAVTAAGAIVTSDVPADTLVAGVPAKVKKHLK